MCMRFQCELHPKYDGCISALVSTICVDKVIRRNVVTVWQSGILARLAQRLIRASFAPRNSVVRVPLLSVEGRLATQCASKFL